jgi:hypothetical protein
VEPTGNPILNPCDLIVFHQRSSTRIYRVMDVDRDGNVATLDRTYAVDEEGERRAYGVEQSSVSSWN